MDSKTIEAATLLSTARTPAVRARLTDAPPSPLLAEVLAHLPGDTHRFVACAPGRLDVLGGLSDYTGALVLSVPTAEHVCVGVERGPADSVTVTLARPTAPDAHAPFTFPASQVFREAEAEGRFTFNGAAAADVQATRCVLGTLAELFHSALIPRRNEGLSIVVGSNLTGLTDVGRDAALSAATAVAVSSAYGLTVDASTLAVLAQQVQTSWLGAVVGVGDAASPLVGEAHALTSLRCDPCTIQGSVRWPGHVTLVGIDCGVVHPDADARFRRARTATLMGRAVIDRIVKHEGLAGRSWDGALAGIAIEDYVQQFRDRIPTKLKGSEYLAHFGAADEGSDGVDPGVVYKVRSRTEHHIYEHARSCQFLDCIGRSADGDEAALTSAGDILCASHWSYGQRCGLGSIETDLLVNLLKQHDTDSVIYSAKASGRGCGGTVAVLMKATDRAWETVREAAAAYESRTGRTPIVLRGSRGGALTSGVQRV